MSIEPIACFLSWSTSVFRRGSLLTIGLMIPFASGLPAAEGDVYVQEIKGLLRTKCVSCHGPLKQEGGLRLDTGSLIRQGGDSGPVVLPEQVAESELLKRISSKDPEVRMPPGGEPLTAEQVRLLESWIAAGASAPEDEQPLADPREHWSFQPVRVSDGKSGIDDFIREKLAEVGLDLAPPADRRTLIRRLSLDLLGLPPTPAQVDAFQNDDSPDAWARLVDKMLASPHYGEHWGQHWLDVVRYADTHGFEVNTPRENAWPYRDYVIRAFNQDLPYDQFIIQQLAGDAVEQDAATGFLVASAVLLPGQIGKDEPSIRLARQDSLDEIVVGTSSTFLGLTIGCARCHDHKFDPISQKDYYALQSFFAGVDYGDREIRDEAYRNRIAEASQVQTELKSAEARLSAWEPVVFPGQTVIVDDEDLSRVELLKEKNGHGENPAGTKRGYRDDPGREDRMPNLSRGRYTWWTNNPGEDVFVYRPRVSGTFRLWISWGAHGSGVHTRDARYVLDRDGDLGTRDDQQELARVDQYYPSGVSTGKTEEKPLWSGLLDVGVQEWREEFCLILRGGDTGTGITADVIILQESLEEGASGSPLLPRLRPAVSPARNSERFPPLRARYVRFTSLETSENNRYEPCLDELEVFTAGSDSRNVALATEGTVARSSGNYSDTGRHQLPHLHDGRYGNDRSWISNERGKGWAELQFPEAVVIDRVVWGRDRQGKLTDRLPVRYRIEVSENGIDWTLVAGDTDRAPTGTPDDPLTTLQRLAGSTNKEELSEVAGTISQLKDRLQRLETHPLVYGGVFREPDQTFLLRRGDPEQPVEPVDPAVPAVFRREAIGVKTEQERRLALARWIASPDHPLTARVLVNRIWQHHFGRGLVNTPNDFGLNGDRPSHPELLDWLAAEFVQGGWSIKELHRRILLSETYQQSSRINPEGATLDADCRLLWRFPSRRLDAESIRDSMLLVSGQLNLEMFGPGFDFFKSRGGLSGFPPLEELGPPELRRMVYAHKVRMEQVPVFGAFDCPDAGQSMPSRGRSTTALQALNLFNSPFVIEQSNHFAERVRRLSPESASAQVEKAFELVLGRLPGDAEREASLQAVGEYGLETLCRALLNSNEFLFLP